jgi:ATP-dependent Clp protease ATP-binding subunit ClpB
MNPETFTEKTNKALSEAQELARENGNAQLTPIHLAVTLFADPEGIARRIASKAGKNS